MAQNFIVLLQYKIPLNMDSIQQIVRQYQICRTKELNLSFNNLTYSVQVNDEHASSSKLGCCRQKGSRKLIQNLTGIFRAGQLNTIMGSSGSGKTTLLNVLACRVDSSQHEGSKAVNGTLYDEESFGTFANYVMQTDVLFQTLTVRETLQFAADLKLNQSKMEKSRTISHLVKKLKLENCIDTLVGGVFVDGISGGEKKRTAIAFELISNPSVLILDEPTSGLDSLTSFIIVQYLKELAITERKTVIMTIHQPNSQIYALFDRLLLLVEGRLIYQGPAEKAQNYFAQNFGLVCPPFHNPADFLMSIMHQQRPQNRCRYPLYFQSYEKLISPKILDQIERQTAEQIKIRKFEVGNCQTLKILVYRDFLNVIRNPHLAKYRILSTVLVTVFTAGVYCRLTGEYVTAKNWNALVGFMFIISIGSLLLAMTPISLIFPSQKSVFLKEENAKLYGTTSYFLSRNIVQIPYSILLPILQALVVYWFVGLSSTASQFFISCFVTFCMTFTGNSLGLIIGSLVDSPQMVSVLTALILNPLILYSGYFKNLDNIPDWISWIQYLSPIKYSFQAFVQNQVQFASESLAYTLNFKQGIWLSLGILMAVGFGYRLLSWFFLWRLRSKLE